MAGGGKFSYYVMHHDCNLSVLLTAINKIIQSAGCIAISSATSGGQPDDLLEHAGMVELLF
jgi:hypothetical protein